LLRGFGRPTVGYPWTHEPRHGRFPVRHMRVDMLALDRLVSECRAAIAAEASPVFVREAVARAVSAPASIVDALGEPKPAEMSKLYHAADLTILQVVWAPMMTVKPHDHRMWAVIGIYSGREDNIFWRRLPGNTARIEAFGARALGTGDVDVLDPNVIHSVTN